MGTVASTVISNTTRRFDKEYHYRIPENLSGDVKPGTRVLVPFGKSNRTVEAFVLKVLEKSEYDGLKEIGKVIDDAPLLDSSMLELVEWMKERYICTYSDAIKCMLPPGIGAKTIKNVKLLSKMPQNSRKAQKILDALADRGGECEYEELKTVAGIKEFSKYIKQLIKNGAVVVEECYHKGINEKTVRVAYLAVPEDEVINDIQSNKIKRIQHIRILEMLLENEYISVQDIIRFSGVSPGVLNTLEKYGYIRFREIEIKRDPYKNRVFEKTFALPPTPQQAKALSIINNALDKESFDEILVHGITGSGKTEVYLQSIQHCIEKGRQAIVLVPEISLTPQMVERFKGRFGDKVAVIHSRLSIGERYDQWRLINEGKIDVVVGARSAVFAPLSRLGLIIIDEEHEGSYKSEITPKYHARDVARERCTSRKAVLVLGSATPSVETYYRAVNGEIRLVEMDERANNAPLPQVDVIDMRQELERGNRSIFSKKLADEIERNIRNSQQTMLLMNRRGYSSFVLCRSCGLALKCANCNITMTYHANDDRLICHYCGYTVKNPSVCPRCKSSHIRHFGIGTQRIEEEVRKCFPDSTVIRMDMDTTSYKNSHEEILSTFREKNINIMVGTQMIAKGHDFPNVTLVGVLAADSMLNINDFRASEKTFQLLTQVAGRAGRGELPGRVVIQTYNTEDFSILAACNHNYKEFYRQEIKLREKLCYPPFTNIASVILSGKTDRSVYNESKALAGFIKESFAQTGCTAAVMGPSRAPLSKIRNRYRWRIIIKCRGLDEIIKVLGLVSDEFYGNKNKRGVDVSMDINPLNML